MRANGDSVKYFQSNKIISIGDIVNADGMHGVVVCDYDNPQTLDGFKDWFISERFVGDGFYQEALR